MKFEHLERSKKAFTEAANRQENKGVEKYGKPLDPLDNYDWLEMATEELVDGFKYLVAEQVKREFIANKIRKLTDDAEIHHWLDELEGVNR